MFFMIYGLIDLRKSNKQMDVPVSFIGYMAIEFLIEAAIALAVYVMWASVLS